MRLSYTFLTSISFVRNHKYLIFQRLSLGNTCLDLLEDVFSLLYPRVFYHSSFKNSHLRTIPPMISYEVAPHGALNMSF